MSSAAPRILVTRRLPDGGSDPLTDAHCCVVARGDDRPYDHHDLVAAARTADAIVGLLSDRFDVEVLDALGRDRAEPEAPRAVATVSVGYDNVDVGAAHDRGITVCHTPGVLDETTADTAFLLILTASRLASTAERELRAGQWPGWGITQYLGRDVHGATLGLIGYGRIARAVARRATGFGLSVLHHSRHDTGEAGYVSDLDRLVADSDIVSLHVPLTPDTHHLIDAARLARMKPTAVLVNTSRGPVVDEAALADALTAGALFAAGCDVYENEPDVHPRLLGAPRAVLLPHIGSASLATRRRMARLACDGVLAALAGRTPSNAVPNAVPDP